MKLKFMVSCFGLGVVLSLSQLRAEDAPSIPSLEEADAGKGAIKKERGEIHKAREEIREKRKEIRHDRKEIRQHRREHRKNKAAQ